MGTLVTTDALTKVQKRTNVVLDETNPEHYVYSTGDVIARDGRVLQVMLGEAVVRLVSGALWTIPLKAGTSGDAVIERTNVDYKAAGTLKWKALAAGDGKVRIDANVQYAFRGIGAANYYPSGKWVAAYSAENPLPESSSAAIKEAGTSGLAINMVSAEFKLR